MNPHRCGTVALIGRPNAGKSTLLNELLGGKLAITSPKPQTTRHRIAGVRTVPGMQAILVDTPGIHKAWTELNKTMVERSIEAISEVDCVLWLEDLEPMAQRAEKGEPILDEPAEHIASLLEAAGRPVIFVANKIDKVPRAMALPVIEAVANRLKLHTAIPVSALKADGTDIILAELAKILPEGPPMFPEDHWTDVSERFLVSEIIREKIFHLTEQEVPYATNVEIERFDETAREKGLVKIYAAIVVERPQQKGIIIGKGGAMLKKIGSTSRAEIEKILECKVYLELFVKVEADWTKSKSGLKRAGFGA